MKTQKSVSPERAFVRLCKHQQLRPVIVDDERGMGIAIDKLGIPYANLGPATAIKHGYELTGPLESNWLDPLPHSLAFRVFQAILDGNAGTWFDTGRRKWFATLAQNLARHEL